MATITTTTLCDNCCSTTNPLNLVSSIFHQEKDDGETISISNGLSSLFSYWMGINDDKVIDLTAPLVLQFCPGCVHIFRKLHKISLQFAKLSSKEGQVAKRLAELRLTQKIRLSSPPPTFKGEEDKVRRSLRGQRKKQQGHPVKKEDKAQVKDDLLDDKHDLAFHIKEEEEDEEANLSASETIDINSVQQYRGDKILPGTEDTIHFDHGTSETRDFGGDKPNFIEAEDAGGDFGSDYDDDFAIDPLKLSGNESSSSNYSPSSPSSGDSDNDIDAPPKPNQCPICFKTFVSLETKDRHFRQQHDETFIPLPCPVDNCDLTFKRRDHLRSHLTRIHPGVPFPPDLQRQTYKKKKKSDDDEGAKRIPCRVATCDKTYSRTDHMHFHMRAVHPEVPIETERRGKTRKTVTPKVKKVKEKRIRKKVVRIKKPCPVCGKEFRACSLNTHIKTHTDERNHLCNTCGKLFRTSRILRLHINDVHIGERKYSCHICGTTFVRKSAYDNHMKNIHEEAEKRWICETCGKTYRQEHNLKEHVKMHSSKSFECPICQKIFSRRANVRLHVKGVHEGVKLRPPREKSKAGGGGVRRGRISGDQRGTEYERDDDSVESENNYEQYQHHAYQSGHHVTHHQMYSL
ncbi:zinc finger protein 16 isoform X2 [Folsomia candida]|uniref:zinc finger protein 16 isoform X2 n=1 Tax=Folsomia candida TaxID=158441 RepID=UPI000B8FCF79|nr:zinc finger protein 16 isoform X2 [Folsomia candida]